MRFSGCLSVQVELCFAHAHMDAFTRHNIHELSTLPFSSVSI